MDSVPAYARFSRRLKALLLDLIVIVLLFYVGAILVNSVSPSDRVGLIRKPQGPVQTV